MLGVLADQHLTAVPEALLTDEQGTFDAEMLERKPSMVTWLADMLILGLHPDVELKIAKCLFCARSVIGSDAVPEFRNTISPSV